MQGVDYSFSRPDIGCLWAAGHRFVVRYTSNGDSAKNATRPEVDALHRQGFRVVIVHQNGTADMLQGYAKGVQDATAAKVKTAALGMPADRPIYFALDQDPEPLTEGQLGACRLYLDGCASVLGRHRVGVYAGYRGIEELCPRWAPWGWQTYAWSRGRISAKARFRQYQNGVDLCGGQVDLNETYRADFGQWPIRTATRPDPIPDDQEDEDMAFTFSYPRKPTYGVSGGTAVGFKNQDELKRFKQAHGGDVRNIACGTVGQYSEYIAAFKDRQAGTLGKIAGYVRRLVRRFRA